MNSLFKSSDPVVILNANDLASSMKIPSKKFKGAGFLFCYAHWCPHCMNKVAKINHIAKSKNIYVCESSENPNLRQKMNIQYFPTFFKVDAKGNITNKVEFETLLATNTQKGGKPVPTYRGLNAHKVGAYAMLKNKRIVQVVLSKNGNKTIVFV